MDEEELLKQKKLMELQSQLQQQSALQEELLKAELAEKIKNNILLEALTKEARERLNNVRLAKPELAAQIELYILQLYQLGKLIKPITDDQLKEILEEVVASTKKEVKIRRL